MKKVSIIAGSKSDERFVLPMEGFFRDKEIEYETSYLSAHRDKEELSAYVTNSDASYFVAVAGLAAALPGSIAADTDKPVTAVPVWGGSTSSPSGLDALLAAVQMPPPKAGENVALGSVTINGQDYAARFIENVIQREKQAYDVTIKHFNRGKEFEKLIGILDCQGITYTPSEDGTVGMLITSDPNQRHSTAAKFAERGQPLICIPVMPEGEVKALTLMRGGKIPKEVDTIKIIQAMYNMYNMAPQAPVVSVGYGRMDNAAYLARKLLGVN